MEDTRLVLSGLWVVLVLSGLWGDVLRIFAGDFKPGEILGMQPSQGMWLGIAVFMLIPIVMVLLNLTLPYPAIRAASCYAHGKSNTWSLSVVSLYSFRSSKTPIATDPALLFPSTKV